MQGDILRLQSIRIFLGGQILTVKSKNYRWGFSLFNTKNTGIATLGCHFTCTQLNLSHRESRPKNLDRIYIKLYTLAPLVDFEHSCATQLPDPELWYFILGSPNRERHHSAGSQSLTKINQINMEPEFTQTQKKIKHQKSSSFSTLKRAKKEWKKLFK